MKNKLITFRENDHTYHDKNGDELQSVSRLIKQYSHEFDPYGTILKKCALKKGISEKELKDEWEKNKNDAAAKGTLFHKDVENFIKTGEIAEGDNKKFIKQFKKVKFKGRIKSELIVGSIEDKIAGTVDIIEFLPGKNISIYDFKTNKELKKVGFFGKMMFPPVSHLPDCNFSHYNLQLSIYAYLMEERGYWINNLTIFFINYKTNKIDIIPLNYLRKEVVDLINNYKRKDFQTIEDKKDSLFDL